MITGHDVFDKIAEKQSRIEEIERTLRTFHRPGDVFEIRVLKIPGRGRPHNAAGYFDDPTRAAARAMEYEERNAGGIYFTINPCQRALLARAPNVILDHLEQTTTDAHIERRRWLYIDLDPERPAGISSTEAELQATERLHGEINEWLRASFRFPAPISGMSGNGYHGHHAIDLPNDDESTALVKSMLRAIAAEFRDWSQDGIRVKVDETVFNAARICKLYGTHARKGFSTPERPHRRSKLLDHGTDCD